MGIAGSALRSALRCSTAMEILYWVLVTYAGVMTVLALVTALAFRVVFKASEEVRTTVISLVRKKDLKRAKEYCATKPSEETVVGSLILLDAASRPYMIPFATEIALARLDANRAPLGYRIQSAINTLSLFAIAFLGYAYYPESTVMKTCAAAIFISGWVFQNYVNKYISEHWKRVEYILTLRNEILLLTNHIPPMYRLHNSSLEDLENWKQSIEVIERDVLLGMDPVTANNEAILRVMHTIETASYDTAGRVLRRDPTGKLDLLTEE